MEIVKYHEESGLLNKGVTEEKQKKKENEVKEQKGGFLGMLATRLGASLLADVIGKATTPGRAVIRAGEGVIRVGEDQDYSCRLIL